MYVLIFVPCSHPTYLRVRVGGGLAQEKVESKPKFHRLAVSSRREGRVSQCLFKRDGREVGGGPTLVVEPVSVEIIWSWWCGV